MEFWILHLIVFRVGHLSGKFRVEMSCLSAALRCTLKKRAGVGL